MAGKGDRKMSQHWENHWRFATKQFEVLFDVAPCEDDPADSFEFEEDIDAVRDGTVDWFDARVRVMWNGKEIAADYLGCCSYNSIEEFYVSHRDPDPMNRNCTIMRRAWQGGNDPDAKISLCHYFPSMVSQAIGEARKVLCSVPRVRCA